MIKASTIHLALTVAWLLAIIPTLIWWRDSILWVAFMSAYANLVGHASAYQASRAKESAQGGDHPSSQVSA
jgi:hypothetical protein